MKIGRYDPAVRIGQTKYEGYCLSTTTQSDPALVKEACDELLSDIVNLRSTLVLHSTLLRARQTAYCIGRFKTVVLIGCTELQEIPFSLGELVSEEEFSKEGSKIVRQKFVRAFVDDRLLETRDSIRLRIEKLYMLLEKLKRDEVSVTLISHSFFMKVLQGVVAGRPIFETPETLGELIHPEQKTFPFGGGFSFQV